MISIELTQAEIILIDEEEEDSVVSLTMAQWDVLVEYVKTHPLDKHGWTNHVLKDGTLTGKHKCPCHDIA